MGWFSNNSSMSNGLGMALSCSEPQRLRGICHVQTMGTRSDKTNIQGTLLQSTSYEPNELVASGWLWVSTVPTFLFAAIIDLHTHFFASGNCVCWRRELSRSKPVMWYFRHCCIASSFTLSSGFFSSSPLDFDVSINAELLVLTSIAANNFRPLAQEAFPQHLLSASLPVLRCWRLKFTNLGGPVV